MTHPADCPCFACLLAGAKRFMAQLVHDPSYEREVERCPVCEIREEEHADVYPCRIDSQD